MIPDSIAGSLKLALLGLLTWACSETGLAQRPLELKVDFFDLRPLGSSMRFFITPGFKELMDEASSVPVLRIEGPDHYPWHIEASSNLLDPGLWRSLGEVRTGPKPILLMDLQGQGSDGVFYRARPLMINPEPDRLVLIPAGTFLMGSPFDEQDRDSDENPMTRVTLSRDYWMGKYEITQGEYLQLMGTNPSKFKRSLDRPVENITWQMAMDYCQRLTEQARQAGRLPEGLVYRLPTEAEWEYACRAGTQTRYPHGDDPDYQRFDAHAWHWDNSIPKGTHPVGMKQPNAWGLHGMLGGVYEWCLGWHAIYPGGEVVDYVSLQAEDRVMRGGAWSDHPRNGRAAERHWFGISQTFGNTGFRVVLAHPYPLIPEG